MAAPIDIGRRFVARKAGQSAERAWVQRAVLEMAPNGLEIPLQRVPENAHIRLMARRAPVLDIDQTLGCYLYGPQ